MSLKNHLFTLESAIIVDLKFALNTFMEFFYVNPVGNEYLPGQFPVYNKCLGHVFLPFLFLKIIIASEDLEI